MTYIWELSALAYSVRHDQLVRYEMTEYITSSANISCIKDQCCDYQQGHMTNAVITN